MMLVTANRLLLAAVVGSLCKIASGQSSTDVINLKTDLFLTNPYDSSMRPLLDQSTELHVYTEFYLFAIHGFDEVEETLRVSGSLQLYWADDFMTWDPSTYGNIEYIFFPQDDLWKPDVALKNSYLDYKQLGHSSMKIQVYNDGLVRWSPLQVFKPTCSVDITYFPYDTQRCELNFVVWSYTKDEVFLEGGANGIQLEDFEGNSAWDIVETSWYNRLENLETSIVFVLTIRRKPLYSLLTLVFPVIMLAILNLFVFALPCDSGEKASYAVTVFLAFAVFMTIMQATFPQNSETLAYFAVYVVLQTVQSTLITMTALIMVRVSSFDEKTKIPRCLMAFARVSKCVQLRRLFAKRRAKVASGVKAGVLPTKNGDTHQVIEVKPTEEELHEADREMTWKELINALDVFCFVFFTIAFLVSTLVCVLVSKYN